LLAWDASSPSRLAILHCLLFDMPLLMNPAPSFWVS
jgi:hypothetical protein